MLDPMDYVLGWTTVYWNTVEVWTKPDGCAIHKKTLGIVKTLVSVSSISWKALIG